MSNSIPETVLSVTQFVEGIDEALDGLGHLTVEGEVSNLKRIKGGQWIVFDLKDESSKVGCFMTKWALKIELEDGMKVRATGAARLRNQGFFSFSLVEVQPAGEGALKRAFELMKKKLTEEGLFSEDRKRPLPRFPAKVALITSRDAAAYSDFIKVLEARQGGIEISFFHTLVQGEDAPGEITAVLEKANTELADLDVIIIVRGGGSMEDLQAFNDEGVVRAVAGSRTPTIVGIGHERDITLAEMTADVRASTPSNAAELLVESRDEILAAVESTRMAIENNLRGDVQNLMEKVLSSSSSIRNAIQRSQEPVLKQLERLGGIGRQLVTLSHTQSDRSIVIGSHLVRKVKSVVLEKSTNVEQLLRLLEGLSPKATMARGYSISYSDDGTVIKSIHRLKQGDRMKTTLKDGLVESTITKAMKNND